jgi:hypothetical protein
MHLNALDRYSRKIDFVDGSSAVPVPEEIPVRHFACGLQEIPDVRVETR